ncbi:hypothetical protein HDU93_004393, partial [Gonapodya sp. JEL0774]
ISNWGDDTWTAESWHAERWMYTYSFPSALTLAVARGGKMVQHDGYTESRPTSDGRVSVNKRGGHVKVQQPQPMSDISEWVQLEPNLGVVEALVRGGATVGIVELKAAKANPDTRFYKTIKDYAISHGDPSLVTASATASSPQHTRPVAVPRPQLRPVSHTSTTVQPPSPPPFDILTLSSLLAEQTVKCSHLSERALAAESMLAATTLESSQLRSRVSQLESQLASTLSVNTSLESRILSLSETVAHLRTENTLLLSRVAAATRPPTKLQRMMYAVVDFVPRGEEEDEMALNVGDAVFVNLGYEDGWGSVSFEAPSFGSNSVLHITS